MIENPNSLISGIEEEVDAVLNRYNFHTHPREAYIRNNVVKGWPSAQDYLGFIDLDGNTIFHSVITLEGVYINGIGSIQYNTSKIDIIRYKGTQ